MLHRTAYIGALMSVPTGLALALLGLATPDMRNMRFTMPKPAGLPHTVLPACQAWLAFRAIALATGRYITHLDNADASGVVVGQARGNLVMILS